jgi:hypothetical protein
VNSGCVSVSWDANSEPDLQGYVGYWGTTSGQYTDSLATGTTAGFQTCGLTQGTYYFAVRAFNDSDEYSGYSTERTVNVTGADTTPPTISSQNPSDGSTGVPLDTQIFFTLQDAQSGVDQNSVAVTINGSPAANIQFFGDASNLGVICQVAGSLPANSVIPVSVTATDQASSPNQVTDNWSFTTGAAADTAPPVLGSAQPADGTTNVNASTAISFQVSDTGAGVDLANLQVQVNGIAQAFSILGGAGSATITIPNTAPYDFGSTVVVNVNACDLSSAQNCAGLTFSFTIASPVVTASGVEGQIIPDGYWVDDPARPLQVENLPAGWTVRIFNTAGTQIRSYHNGQVSGSNWTWDFANDSGRRVARALYLVRVFDGSGNMQQSGRFLVQSD